MKAKLCKLQAILLALCLLAGLPAPRALAAGEAETGETVTLSTPEDFLAFAENCTLNAWSQGKTFTLDADLDLTGWSVAPVPTFGGVFLGQGHTISGLRVTADGSNMGLFRFVQAGAVIRDLTVSGQVTPGGSAANVGGLAGSNAGSLQNCVFQGVVKGKSAVGGLVGENRASGELAGCSASGSVSGESCTGGLVGRNLGVLLKCQNSAAVNTSVPDSSGSPVTENTLSQLTSPTTGGQGAEGTADSLFSSYSDTGGVAGYSGGVIQSCVNNGAVGYPHVGYNVGGVAGRQAGYLADCANHADIRGRKDVGGIVGQAEPDVILNTGEDTLAQLRRELNTLDSLVERALDHADANRAQLSAQLTALGETAGDARDHTKTLLDHVSDFADDNLDSLNTLAAAVTAALDGLAPALDDLSNAADGLELLGGQLSGALDTLADAGRLSGDVLTQAGDAAEDLGQTAGQLRDAAQTLDDALDDLQQAVIIRDQAAVQRANRRLASAVRDLGAALRSARTALDALERALSNGLGGGADAIEAVRGIRTALGGAGDALDQAGLAIDDILVNVDLDWTALQIGLDNVGLSLDDLALAAQSLRDATGDLGAALDSAGPVADALGDAAGQFSDAADTGSSIAADLQSAFGTLRDVTARLAEDGDVRLTPLGQETRDAGNDLYASLTDLSQTLTDIHATVDDAGEALDADLRAISRQINKIFNLMLDSLDNAATVEAPEDLFGDVSEEDVGGTRLGKVSGGVNTGTVEGDRNVGGVAGAVAVEYSLDPEDDVSRFTFGSTYELRAILENCVNRGAASGRRDCVGGVAGRMDLGTAVGCESYGPVSGSDRYVGGIAGYADAALRGCWVKCPISGTEYVGGVVGWGSTVTDCRAIPSILSGTEYVGSIAGGADLEGGEVRDNYFLDTGTAGIDGVDYAQVAQRVPFDVLQGDENAPVDFLSFSITLTVDGQTVERIPFQFGDDLSALTLPPTPAREGFYGVWPPFDPSGVRSDLTLEAVYTPWVTLVASEETQGSLALALAEGRFTEEAVLSVQPDQAVPPPEGNAGQVWSVTLTGTELTDSDSIPLRLLNQSGKGAAVWQFTDGGWQKRDATVNGSYLCLTMDGTSGVFCVRPVSGSYLRPVLLAAGGAALAAALLLLAKRAGKKRRGRRAAHAA